MALKLALCVLAATPGALCIRPTEHAHVAQRAALSEEAAASSRNLLLFGLTQRDKAAHDEHRDAMIEVRAPRRPLLARARRQPLRTRTCWLACPRCVLCAQRRRAQCGFPPRGNPRGSGKERAGRRSLVRAAPQEEFNQLVKAEAIAEEAIEVRSRRAGGGGQSRVAAGTRCSRAGAHPRVRAAGG